jgi:hypothetical protein
LESFLRNYERLVLYFKGKAEEKGMPKEEIMEVESGDGDDEMVDDLDKEKEKEEEKRKCEVFYKKLLEKQFLIDICMLSKVYERHQTACKRLQEMSLDISSFTTIINELITALQKVNDDNEILKLITETTTLNNLPFVFNDSDKSSITNQCQMFVQKRIGAINIRFQKTGRVSETEEIIMLFNKIFNPSELKKMKCNKDNNKQLMEYINNMYFDLAYHFRQKFSKTRLDECLQDWRKLKVDISRSQIKTPKEMCKFIMETHGYLDNVTGVRLSQFFLILSPTSVAVERCFRDMNLQKNALSSKMKNEVLNNRLIVKKNTQAKLSKAMLTAAANQWLTKSRRYLNELLKTVQEKMKAGIPIAAYSTETMTDMTEGDDVIKSENYIHPKDYAIACLAEKWEEDDSKKK